MNVIGVRFKSTKKIYYFNPNGLDIKKNDNVVVETSRGIEFGQTVIGVRDVPEDQIVQPLQKVIRIATPEDERTVEVNAARQKDAFDKCLKKIEQHGLDMKLVDAEYTFDGTKLIFYFTSDGRVDFRELVKDLATLFRTRIELRQIAVRDETKMLGGLGACGNEICCKRFLGDFASVSIKMAKEQNLSLNPTKISGLCGRLICCLNFEKDFYNDMNHLLPSQDEVVMSPKGQATVVSTYPLKESVRVKYTNPDGSTDTAVFHINDITRIQPGQNPKEVFAEGDDADFIPDEENGEGVVAVARSKNKPRANDSDRSKDEAPQAGKDEAPRHNNNKKYNKPKPNFSKDKEQQDESKPQHKGKPHNQGDFKKRDKKPEGQKPQNNEQPSPEQASDEQNKQPRKFNNKRRPRPRNNDHRENGQHPQNGEKAPRE